MRLKSGVVTLTEGLRTFSMYKRSWHARLGHVRLFYEWEWSGAEQTCKQAIKLNPNYAWGHAIWSDWLVAMGRLDEAIAEERLAVELDPLSPGLNARLGAKLGLRGEY